MALLLAWPLLDGGNPLEEAAWLEVALLDTGPELDATAELLIALELLGFAELVAEELAALDELTGIDEDAGPPEELTTFELLTVFEELPTVEELPTTEDDGTAGNTPASSAKVLSGIDTCWPVTLSTNFNVLSQQSSLQQSSAVGSS